MYVCGLFVLVYSLDVPCAAMDIHIGPVLVWCSYLYVCRVVQAQKDSYGMVNSPAKSSGGMNRLWNMFSGVTSGASESTRAVCEDPV